MAASASAYVLPAPTVGAPRRLPAAALRCHAIPSRRRLLLLTAAPLALTAAPAPSGARDIPLFGLRKKIEKIEQEAGEIVREGEMAVEGGIEAAEKEIQAAEKGIEEAEKEVEEGLLVGGGPVQAAAVAGAEAVGVIIGVSVVNAILGPEAQRT